MPSNYENIRLNNERRYGTDIGRIGPMLLADRYDKRTHFIFELLQNIEDALSRRENWAGSRTVKFNLSDTLLSISHYGQEFSENDVKGICGINESTKDLTSIGRFGIGFKSVYTFTDRPEVHSGSEAFAIENFVWPVSVSAIERDDDETLIIIPLKSGIDKREISEALRQLSGNSLLFLRQIDEIVWSISDGESGGYRRTHINEVDKNIRIIKILTQDSEETDIEDKWLIFSRHVFHEEIFVGYVEIAFSLRFNQERNHDVVERLGQSPLVVFFPTVLETNLGFMLQGPYRTTPSRDNIPRNNLWNEKLVIESSQLLIESLRWLSDRDQLDVKVLSCLPLDDSKFKKDNMFFPLFEKVKDAIYNMPLLPKEGGGYVSAKHAKLAGSKNLRSLISPFQLRKLLSSEEEIYWLDSKITPKLTSDLWRYLVGTLNVIEFTPEMLVSKLNKEFLEDQTDEWICELYDFLNSQSGLVEKHQERMTNVMPLIRLDNGQHVVAKINGHMQAFLPSEEKTDFPTIKQQFPLSAPSPLSRP